MSRGLRSSSKKPAVVTFVQILLYLTAVVNLGNGIYSLSNAGTVKVVLSVAMIIFGVTAVWVATRLGHPIVSRRKNAIALSWILIVLRIIEFSVWHSIGFLLGIILPIIIIWRLNKAEAKAWYVSN